MNQAEMETLVDYVSGAEVPNVGAEANRQAVEQYLVEQKGYDKADIEVDAPIAITVNGEPYRSRLDLLVRVGKRRFMAIKCAAGSLDSRQKEILSAARIADAVPIPLAVASDGQTARVWESFTGKLIGQGWEAVPDRQQAAKMSETLKSDPMPEKRREQEKIIFRSYDGMNVNRA